MKTLAYIIVLSSILLTACSSTSAQPTATAAETLSPTETIAATATITLTPPPTATSAPTATHTPDPILDLVPHGTPDTEWNGIPIMAGALAGSGDLSSYRFTIKATDAEIQAFYQKELKAAGWIMLAAGSNKKGTNLLIFTKGDKTLTVSIIEFEGSFIVMFVE